MCYKWLAYKLTPLIQKKNLHGNLLLALLFNIEATPMPTQAVFCYCDVLLDNGIEGASWNLRQPLKGSTAVVSHLRRWYLAWPFLINCQFIVTLLGCCPIYFLSTYIKGNDDPFLDHAMILSLVSISLSQPRIFINDCCHT